MTAFQNSSSATGFVLPGLKAARDAIARPSRAEPTLPWDGRRVAALDGVRLIAALAVVWTHCGFAGGWAHVGRMGTTFFVITAVLFVMRAARTDAERTYGRYLAERCRRLLLPCLIWATISMLPVQVRSLHTDGHLYLPTVEEWLCGRSRNLWFLPFAMLLSTTVYPLGLLIARLPGDSAGTIAKGFCVLGGLFACLPDQNFEGLGRHAFLPERIWECLPVLCWAISLDIWLRLNPKRPSRAWMAYAGLGLIALTYASLFTYGFTVAGKNISGVGLFLIALGTVFSSRWRLLAGLGTFSFSIYLVHSFVIGVLRQLFFDHADGTLELTLPLFATAAVLSFGLAVLLRQSRWTAWTVA